MRCRVYSAFLYAAPALVPRCTCRSISPGTRNFPAPLIFSTPAGIGMLARLPMARMRLPATITTEFEIGGPPVPSISTAPMMAFCRDSSGGLHAARHNAAIARSQTLSGRANTHPSCQNSSCVWRRELKKKLECGPAARPHSPLRRLLGFSEPAGTGDELDAIERAFAVDVPVLFQLVERTGFRRPLSAIHPFGVVVVDHLPLRVVFHHRDGGRVLIDHMDRPVQ